MPVSQLIYDESVHPISQIQFGILSPERILERSVCEIYKHIVNTDNPVGTLMDPRLGVIERGKICPTCHQDYKGCPGHYGHVNLAKPVIAYKFLDETLLQLSHYCLMCSALLCDHHADLKARRGRGRTAYVTKHRAKECPNCSAQVPEKYQILKDGIGRINAVYPKTKGGETPTVALNPQMILDIFTRITPMDVELGGGNPLIAHPKWMIMTVLLVGPPHMRPSVKNDAGKVSDDDLTFKLNDIIKYNNQLRNKLTEPTQMRFIDDYWQMLQYHVATYADNELSGVVTSTHRSGRPLKTITQRLSGKEGLVRSNLMGKRGNFSARSVITPEPNACIDQLMIPQQHAMNLSYPELVTTRNLSHMKKLIINGANVYPGAKSFQKKHETTKTNLKYYENRADLVVEPGDIVYRHLLDDDYVLFNRQPSLHKMSMMAHRAKIMPWHTLRFNPNCTSPYNADFDGDEMNFHVPQTLEEVTELKYLCSVLTQLLSAQSSANCIGAVQDCQLGLYLLTKKQTPFSRIEFMRLMSWMSSNKPIPKTLMGHDVLTQFMPDITYSNGGFKIVNGTVVPNGIITKNITGAKRGSLIHVSANDLGPVPTGQLLDNLNFISKESLLMTGFTVGIDHILPTEDMTHAVQQELTSTNREVAKLIEEVKLGRSDGVDPMQIKEEFPLKMSALMNRCRDVAGKATSQLVNPDNAINIMVSAGSKGNSLNLIQLLAMIGQQEIDGTWLENQLNRRPLAHFPRDDLRPEAHGFIANSYTSGMTPTEYFSHAQAGRIGVVDKAIKTAKTGYIQHKLIKVMEDNRVAYDGTVRNANHQIIQFIYGGDGFDASYQEHQSLPFVQLNRAEFENIYRHQTQDGGRGEASKSEVLNRTFQEYELINKYYTYIRTHYESIETVKSPIHIQRLIQTAQAKFAETIEPEDADYFATKVVELVTKRLIWSPIPALDFTAGLILRSLILSNLASKLVVKMRMSKVAFDFIIEQIFIRFQQTLMTPGENCGMTGAQSIGEPTTQLTLNAIHSVGLGSKAKVTRGVDRIIELFGLTKQQKTPSDTVRINLKTLDEVVRLASSIEHITLRSLVLRTEIIYDPDDHKSCILSDQPFIDGYLALLPSLDTDSASGTFPWLFRMEFNREAILKNQIDLWTVESRLSDFLTNKGVSFTVMISDINAQKIICRIKCSSIPSGYNILSYLHLLELQLMEVEVQGIVGISRGLIRPEKIAVKAPDGRIILPHHPEHSSMPDNIKYTIDTEGSNLIDLLNHPAVDRKHTYSNDIWEIFQLYGVESARQAFINETIEVLEVAGTYVASRHLESLADIMFNLGLPVSVDRHGVNKSDSGPLHRASFEETVRHFFNASISAETDHLDGVSGNVMFGQLVPTGTNAFAIGLVPDDLLKTASASGTLTQTLTKPNIEVVKRGQVSAHGTCALEDFEFDFIPNWN
jgi:DNA-directed RNA polymerase II subunit RPB1